MVDEYSRRLGKIFPEQFQSALERFGLGLFVRAEPIPFGLFGQNVFVTSTQGEFVLRGVPHYAWQFPTEQFFADKLHYRTRVPVPFPYQVDPDIDIFGWSYVIMPRLSGIPLSDKSRAASFPIKDRLAIARALARTLAEAHTLTWDCGGKYDPETRRVLPFDKGYAAWVVECIREKLGRARSYNSHTTASDSGWVETIIKNSMDALSEPERSCVVLGDYGEHNVLVDRDGSGWRVSAVFDLMTAHFGDGEADLSLPVTDYLSQNRALADAFIQEYTRRVVVRPSFAARQKVFMLNLKLSFWEYWQREKGGMPEDPTHALSLQQWAGPSIAYWNEP
jgi:hygromycin-B 7''-O-kinase